MVKWAGLLLIVALIAAVIGFGGLVVDLAATIAKVLFFVFLVLFIAAFLLGRRVID